MHPFKLYATGGSVVSIALTSAIVTTPTPQTYIDRPELIDICAQVEHCVTSLGLNGLHCWDTNGNGVGDPAEDINGDGLFDAFDCQGPGAGGLDADWQVVGDNMHATPTGNVAVGTLPHGQIKFGAYSDDDAVQIGGSFTKQSSATQVGSSIGARGLSIDAPGTGTGLYGQAQSSTGNSIALGGIAISDGNAAFGTNVQTQGAPEALSVGGQFVANCATDVQYGAYAISGTWPLDVRINMGLRGIGYGNDEHDGGSNFGVQAEAYHGLGTATNIGLNARASRPPSAIQGSPTINYAGSFYADDDGAVNRSVYCNGTLEVTGPTLSPSDRRLKRDILDYRGEALGKVLRLKPRSYRFRDDVSELNLPAGRQVGFLADEIQVEFPDLVHQSARPRILDDEGSLVEGEFFYRTVNYTALIPVLTAALQEQHELILGQSAELSDLRSRLTELESIVRELASSDSD